MARGIVHAIPFELPQNVARFLCRPVGRMAHGVVHERIRDECVIKIPCIDPKSDVHLSTRSGKKKKGRRGRCGRRAPRFVCDRRMGAHGCAAAFEKQL